MKAPEKIYIDPHPYEECFEDEWYESPMSKASVEYTRTDAFIEKACEFLKDRIEHDSIDYPMATMHLINDFRHYMKG